MLYNTTHIYRTHLRIQSSQNYQHVFHSHRYSPHSHNIYHLTIWREFLFRRINRWRIHSRLDKSRLKHPIIYNQSTDFDLWKKEFAAWRFCQNVLSPNFVFQQTAHFFSSFNFSIFFSTDLLMASKSSAELPCSSNGTLGTAHVTSFLEIICFTCFFTSSAFSSTSRFYIYYYFFPHYTLRNSSFFSRWSTNSACSFPRSCFSYNINKSPKQICTLTASARSSAILFFNFDCSCFNWRYRRMWLDYTIPPSKIIHIPSRPTLPIPKMMYKVVEELGFALNPCFLVLSHIHYFLLQKLPYMLYLNL